MVESAKLLGNQLRATHDGTPAVHDMRFTAGYIVGCDGARSIIRMKLFDDGDLPGHTLEEQIVATNASVSDCHDMLRLMTRAAADLLRL